MLRVGINGYGTIGKRVADAVTAQPDMEVTGVAKTRPNFEAERAVEKGYPLYAAIEDRASQFGDAGIELAGNVPELVEESDVIVDATPSGIGEQNKALYEEYDTPALFQGGEDADFVDTSFNARSNFENAIGADYVRVVSCNTTGLSRLIAPLVEEYGVEKVRATLVRRGGDPSQTSRGPINDILPNPVSLPSHHGPDVRTIFPDLDIDTLGLKVPSTLMHVHSLNLELGTDVTADDVKSVLADERRIKLVRGVEDIDGTAKLKELALDIGRPRGDFWENAVWGDSITIEDGELYLFQAIHQESNVVLENVDALRAVGELADAEESMQLTNDALDVGF